MPFSELGRLHDEKFDKWKLGIQVLFRCIVLECLLDSEMVMSSK